jgi:RNA polymerase sigma-70 factor (ECF subfamily)
MRAGDAAPNRGLHKGDADHDLVEAIRRGDATAWDRLINRYQHRLFTVCFRMVHDRDDAAELTQETFLKAVRAFDRFDGRAALSTWLIRIAMNVCLSALRAKKVRKHQSLDAIREETGSRGAAWEPASKSRVEPWDERRIVLWALGEMEEEQRAILVLRDSRGLEYDQIAQVLNVPVGTVKSRLFRARAALRALIEEARNEELPPRPEPNSGSGHGPKDGV